MADTLAAAAELAVDPAFRGRIQVALVYTARGVREEPQTPSANERRKLALSILKAPSGLVDTAAWTLASIPGITNATADVDLLPIVAALLQNLIGS